MISDPWKLVPFVLAVGVIGALLLGKLSATEFMTAIGSVVAIHAGISAVSNVNPPKDQGR